MSKALPGLLCSCAVQTSTHSPPPVMYSIMKLFCCIVVQYTGKCVVRFLIHVLCLMHVHYRLCVSMGRCYTTVLIFLHNSTIFCHMLVLDVHFVYSFNMFLRVNVPCFLCAIRLLSAITLSVLLVCMNMLII